MKYHKIPRVEKTVCVAEQVIAYHLAFNAYVNFDRRWEEAATEESRAALLEKIIGFELGCLTPKRNVNPEAVEAILSRNLAAYLDNHHIYTSYGDVGIAFPLPA